MAGHGSHADQEPILIKRCQLLEDSRLDQVSPFWLLDFARLLEEGGKGPDELVLVDVFHGDRLHLQVVE